MPSLSSHLSVLDSLRISRLFLPSTLTFLLVLLFSLITHFPNALISLFLPSITCRFEDKGFTLRGLKLYTPPRELLEQHYGDLAGKPFFPSLMDYMTSGPVCCMAWEGKGVVATGRKMLGATNPLESAPGTIRGDFAIDVGRNVRKHMPS